METQEQKLCFLTTPQDSSLKNAKAEIVFFNQHTGGRILKTPKDSRIWEIESVLFKPRKEIRLERLSTQRGAEIADSSPKAESKKPTLTQRIRQC